MKPARDTSDQPRSLRFRLSQAERERLVQDYVSGMPTTQLTQQYGLAKGTVLRILADADVSMRRQGVGEEDVARLADLYEQGLSVASVATQLGYAPTSVARALRRAGVELRPGRRRG
jgi:transposase-like protein